MPYLRVSARTSQLPVYAVGELASLKRRLVADGVDVIDVAAGDADFPPPPVAVDALSRALRDPPMNRYGFQVGLPAFREAVAGYMQRRFGVSVDPFAHVLPLIGSKEGLAHFAFAVLEAGDVCVVPDPGYPPYVGGAVLAGAQVYSEPLTVDRGFLLDLAEVPQDVLARTRLVYLNYPNNPTTAVAPREYLEKIVAVCRRSGIVLAYDNPYCELTFDGYRAPSIFEVDGAWEVAVEFHSLSKSFAMTGWRLAWAVGNTELIRALSTVKSFVDTGPFLAIQAAGAAVLDHAEAAIAPIRAALAERRDVGVQALREAGLTVERPAATMYLWAQVPQGHRSAAFARTLLERTGAMLVPGSAFGAAGEGFVRVALTVNEERLQELGRRIASCVVPVEVADAP